MFKVSFINTRGEQGDSIRGSGTAVPPSGMFLTTGGTSAAQAARAIARVVIMTAAKRIVRGKSASECTTNVEFTRGNRGDMVWEPPVFVGFRLAYAMP